MPARLGVDIGGTFTDLVVVDETTGVVSVGKVLTGWTIKDACEAGVLTFDFGQGDAEYKRFWATDSHDVHRVAAGRGPAGLAFVLWRRALWRAARISWAKSAFRSLRRALKGRPPAPVDPPAAE